MNTKFLMDKFFHKESDSIDIDCLRGNKSPYGELTEGNFSLKENGLAYLKSSAKEKFFIIPRGTKTMKSTFEGISAVSNSVYVLFMDTEIESLETTFAFFECKKLYIQGVFKPNVFDGTFVGATIDQLLVTQGILSNEDLAGSTIDTINAFKVSEDFYYSYEKDEQKDSPVSENAFIALNNAKPISSHQAIQAKILSNCFNGGKGKKLDIWAPNAEEITDGFCRGSYQSYNLIAPNAKKISGSQFIGVPATEIFIKASNLTFFEHNTSLTPNLLSLNLDFESVEESKFLIEEVSEDVAKVALQAYSKVGKVTTNKFSFAYSLKDDNQIESIDLSSLDGISAKNVYISICMGKCLKELVIPTVNSSVQKLIIHSDFYTKSLTKDINLVFRDEYTKSITEIE